MGIFRLLSPEVRPAPDILRLTIWPENEDRASESGRGMHMLGAIAGDIIGSRFEGHNVKTTEGWDLFDKDGRCRFTDDTVLTLATAEALLDGSEYAQVYRKFARTYPGAGYGGAFRRWFLAPECPGPYNSFGNGSAMRVAPIAWAKEALEDVLAEAARSAVVTHDHPEGIKGAQAVATAVFLARKGSPPMEVRALISSRFGYDLARTIEEIRPVYKFDLTCQGSVPEAITAALEGSDFEDVIRRAISLGGDSDTIACIAGAIAEARFGCIPERIQAETLSRLTAPLRALTTRFLKRFLPEVRSS